MKTISGEVEKVEMNPLIEIMGIYEIEAREPCYLVEMSITNAPERLDLMSFTQEILGQSQDNWQVPYDEHFLTTDGAALYDEQHPWVKPAENNIRFAFFFHYLDLNKPLQTGFGEVTLPHPTEKPDRLGFITYVPVD